MARNMYTIHSVTYLLGHYKRRKLIYWDKAKRVQMLGISHFSRVKKNNRQLTDDTRKQRIRLRLDFCWNAWSVWNVVWISSWDILGPRQYLFGHDSALNTFKQTITSPLSRECFNSAWLHGLATTMTSGVGVEGDDVGLLRLLTPNRPDCISQHQWSDPATTRDLLRMVTSTIDLSDGLPRGNVAAPGCDAELT